MARRKDYNTCLLRLLSYLRSEATCSPINSKGTTQDSTPAFPKRHLLPPSGACQYGCDGSGWHELLDHEEPGDREFDIYWQGGWWTVCRCNLMSTDRHDQQPVSVRKYPPGYVAPVNDLATEKPL